MQSPCLTSLPTWWLSPLLLLPCPRCDSPHLVSPRAADFAAPNPRVHVYPCVCARFCAHARACTDSRATPLFPTHVHVHVRVRVRVRVRACACVCVRVRLPCVHRRMRRASHGIHTSPSEVTANLDPEAVDHIFLHLARRAVQPQPRGSTESTCQGTSTACGFCTTSPVETPCIFGHSLLPLVTTWIGDNISLAPWHAWHIFHLTRDICFIPWHAWHIVELFMLESPEM